MGYMKDSTGKRLDDFEVAGARSVRPAAQRVTPLDVLDPAPTLTLSKSSGVSAITVASGGSGYVLYDLITLTGGTFVKAAVLMVTSVSGGAVTNAAIIRSGAYTTQPSNPVAQGSTSGSGTGATFNLTFNAGAQSTITDKVYALATSTSAFYFGGCTPAQVATSDHYGSSVRNDVASFYEWTTDAATFDIRILGNNMNFLLTIDGQRVDTGGATDASGAWYLYTVDWSGVVKPRTYRLTSVNMGFAGLYVPPTASVWKPTEPRRPLAIGLGDSYMFGTGATRTALSAFNTMCDILGLEPLADGIGGKGWNSTSTDAPATRLGDKLAGLTRDPNVIFLDMGYNDAGGNMTTAATAFDATVAAARAAVPDAQIIAFGPATPVGETANLILVKNMLSGRCAALGVDFIDVSTLVTSSNKSVYTDVDNTHPNQAGHDYLGARKAQLVAPVLNL